MIYPLPAVLVSCGKDESEYNIITVAWTGTICTNPPMCYISVRPERHSYDIIKKNMEFVINLTTKDMAFPTDWCGVRSGRNYRKFEEMKLTPGRCTVVSAPLIEESPLCIECRVKEIVSLGSNIILFGWMAIACTAFAQDRNADKVERPNTKKINFGIKAGFNSSMFMVSELKIKDVTIDEVQNNYKIGYFGAIFMRFNIKKHFIQPEASYNVSKGEITFDKLGSQHPAIEPDYASVQSVLHSIDFPILYGYNVVKKGPYGMSIFAGPKLRYLWGKQNEITFTNFDQKGIHEKLYPLNVSVVIGVGVNISRIFFDFRYEQGIGNISKSIVYDNINSDGSTGVSPIIFRRRDSALSFSFGFIL